MVGLKNLRGLLMKEEKKEKKKIGWIFWKYIFICLVVMMFVFWILILNVLESCLVGVELYFLLC